MSRTNIKKVEAYDVISDVIRTHRRTNKYIIFLKLAKDRE